MTKLRWEKPPTQINAQKSKTALIAVGAIMMLFVSNVVPTNSVFAVTENSNQIATDSFVSTMMISSVSLGILSSIGNGFKSAAGGIGAGLVAGGLTFAATGNPFAATVVGVAAGTYVASEIVKDHNAKSDVKSASLNLSDHSRPSGPNQSSLGMKIGLGLSSQELR